MANFSTEIINGHEVEVCAGGELRVKEGWIWIEKKICCICQENKICLGFDTSFCEYGQIDICNTCIDDLWYKSHELSPEILRKKFIEYESKVKYDEHGHRITAKEEINGN